MGLVKRLHRKLSSFNQSKYREVVMNIQRNFYRQMIVLYEADEIEDQIEFLMGIDPKTEELSEMVQRMLLDAINDDKQRKSS